MLKLAMSVRNRHTDRLSSQNLQIRLDHDMAAENASLKAELCTKVQPEILNFVDFDAKICTHLQK